MSTKVATASKTNQMPNISRVAQVGVQSVNGVQAVLTDVTEDDVYTSLVPLSKVDEHIKMWIKDSYARGNRTQTFLNEFHFEDYRHFGRLQVFLPTESDDLIQYFVKKIMRGTPEEYD